jgi:hypothetical protein
MFILGLDLFILGVDLFIFGPVQRTSPTSSKMAPAADNICLTPPQMVINCFQTLQPPPQK